MAAALQINMQLGHFTCLVGRIQRPGSAEVAVLQDTCLGLIRNQAVIPPAANTEIQNISNRMFSVRAV